MATSPGGRPPAPRQTPSRGPQPRPIIGNALGRGWPRRWRRCSLGSSQARRQYQVRITELRTDEKPAELGAATVRRLGKPSTPVAARRWR